MAIGIAYLFKNNPFRNSILRITLYKNYKLEAMQAAIRKLTHALITIFIAYMAVVVVVFVALFNANSAPANPYILPPALETFIETAAYKTADKSIILGYELMVRTPLLIGPQVADTTMRYTGNALACTSCHLHQGTKAYGIPLNTVVARFPQYRGREDKIGTLQERINGCLARSMNGRMMGTSQKEMKAFVAYLTWLSTQKSSLYATAEEKGLKPITLPSRKADVAHGATVYATHCVRCHGENGQGALTQQKGLYAYPPLWGSKSYNNGAGMTRLITAAQFIKYNMPFGVTHENPVLTDAEAYDVAAYINQKERPIKDNLTADFPNKIKKPVSTPYPPFLDLFPLEQHQLGPYGPIMVYYSTTYGVVKTK